jgi:hypothetical protein
MKIIFDSQTRLSSIQSKIIAFPEIVPKARKQVTETIDIQIFDFFGMTISEFLQLQENKLPLKVQKFLSGKKTTFFDYLKILNTFEVGAKSFERILIDTTIKAEADEEAARVGLIDITTEEAMLTFLRDYFGLQSLEKAQELTLYEYITARKISFNNAKFQKNLINIQKIKI